jgi:hypothetical protein
MEHILLPRLASSGEEPDCENAPLKRCFFFIKILKEILFERTIIINHQYSGV